MTNIFRRVNRNTRKTAFRNSFINVMFALLPLDNLMPLLVLANGGPIFREAVWRACGFLILRLPPGTYPHVVAAVFFEDIGRQHKFKAGSTSPRDWDALGVIHEDRQILSMIRPVALVSDAILKLCNAKDIDAFKIPWGHL